jgi:hypothetical protein
MRSKVSIIGVFFVFTYLNKPYNNYLKPSWRCSGLPIHVEQNTVKFLHPQIVADLVHKKCVLTHVFIILLIPIAGVCASPRKITIELEKCMLILSSNTQGKFFLYHNLIPKVPGTSKLFIQSPHFKYLSQYVVYKMPFICIATQRLSEWTVPYLCCWAWNVITIKSINVSLGI